MCSRKAILTLVMVLWVGLGAGLLAPWGAATAQPVRFLGESATPEALDPEAAEAWAFARDALGAGYVACDEVEAALADGARVLWWHHARPELPAPLQHPRSRAAVLAWLNQGGGLLLTGFGPRYAERLDLAPFPTRVRNQPTVSGSWGFQVRGEHP
ncbi:MAG: hypothetical protein AAGA57_12130, partial [Planctomycetota bacterium]